jgi:2-keto-4-pentenoate hydratase/2-oxohepta-3-ene-1,7-dioic acid hydratase in catechol pathway
MKIARYLHEGRVAYGLVEDDAVTEIQGDIFGQFSATDRKYTLDQVTILTPCAPTKVLAVGLNYASHIGDEHEPTKEPLIFQKSPSSLLQHEGTIVLPRGSGLVEHEGELVIVMKKQARQVKRENALEYVLGYTCGDDVSSRKWQKEDMEWWRAKAADTFGPLGPYIVTDIDPGNLDIQVRINGAIQQEGNTSDFIFDVPTIISFISDYSTLEAGDVIYTGTPGIPGAARDGDVVEVEISGIGVLRSYVADQR